MTRTLAALLVVLGSGCATNLSTLQTAKTLRPGQIRIAAGTGVYIPAGQAVNAAAEGFSLARRGIDATASQQPLVVTNSDRDAIITAGVALATLPPASSWELSARVGLFDNFDVGLRYGLNAVRGDAKLRLLHGGDSEEEGAGGRRSYDLAIGIGVSKYLFSNPVIDALEVVKLGDFNRWDVEVPIYLSADFNPYFGIYFAPKYVYSHTTFDENLVELSKGVGTCNCSTTTLQLPSVVDMHFIGATAGLRAGLPRLSLFVELTAGDTIARPTVLGKPRDLGGLTLYPSIGLAATFR